VTTGTKDRMVIERQQQIALAKVALAKSTAGRDQ